MSGRTTIIATRGLSKLVGSWRCLMMDSVSWDLLFAQRGGCNSNSRCDAIRCDAIQIEKIETAQADNQTPPPSPSVPPYCYKLSPIYPVRRRAHVIFIRGWTEITFLPLIAVVFEEP